MQTTTAACTLSYSKDVAGRSRRSARARAVSRETDASADQPKPSSNTSVLASRVHAPTYAGLFDPQFGGGLAEASGICNGK